MAYAWSSLSAVGNERPSRVESLLLGVLHGGTLLAAAAITLATASPRFVPDWLR